MLDLLCHKIKAAKNLKSPFYNFFRLYARQRVMLSAP